MRETFTSLHPTILFVYLLAMILLSLLLMSLDFVLISVAAALANALRLNGRRGIRFTLTFVLPFSLLLMLLNPLFNHQGVTVLFYLGRNPITVESLRYGMFMTGMYAAVILWFSCYNTVMTADKSLAVFGGALPSLTLLLTMAMRFIPQLTKQTKDIANAQKGIGRDLSAGSLKQRLQQALRIISMLLTWALENAVESADSLKSRGYGLPGRSRLTLRSINVLDKRILVGILILLSMLAIAGGAGLLTVEFFPRYAPPTGGPLYYLTAAAYALLAFLPLICDISEDLRWRYYENRMEA